MATFVNKKERVFDIELTSYGRYLMSVGKFKPEYYAFYDGNTDLINEELDLYKSISREDIRQVARKYLNTNQRLELHYLPESQKEEK